PVPLAAGAAAHLLARPHRGYRPGAWRLPFARALHGAGPAGGGAVNRGVCAAANRADMESAPTEVCGIAGFACSRLVTGLAPVRRGGIYPARRRVSEANRHAAAALRPENPPAEPRAAAN